MKRGLGVGGRGGWGLRSWGQVECWAAGHGGKPWGRRAATKHGAGAWARVVEAGVWCASGSWRLGAPAAEVLVASRKAGLARSCLQRCRLGRLHGTWPPAWRQAGAVEEVGPGWQGCRSPASHASTHATNDAVVAAACGPFLAVVGDLGLSLVKLAKYEEEEGGKCGQYTELGGGRRQSLSTGP